MISLGLIVMLLSSFSLVLTISPIPVIEHWSLTTSTTNYKTGDIVDVHSVGVKRFKMPSVHVERTLMCTTGTKTSTYQLPSSSNTSVQNGPFDIHVKILLPLTLDSLPRSCKIDIDVKYPIYGFKAHGETNEFIINAE